MIDNWALFIGALCSIVAMIPVLKVDSTRLSFNYLFPPVYQGIKITV